MLVKVALVVLLLTSLLTAGMDDQQTIAVPAAATEEAIDKKELEEKSIKTVSAVDNTGWEEEITPVTFALFR
jgi:hypothetical protein